jgi:hypothetical protein
VPGDDVNVQSALTKLTEPKIIKRNEALIIDFILLRIIYPPLTPCRARLFSLKNPDFGADLDLSLAKLAHPPSKKQV